MNDRNRQLKKYYRRIKSWLPGTGKQNKLILANIHDNISAHLSENPEISADEIERRFGTPQQIAAACVNEMGMEELLHRLRVRKKILSTIHNAAICLVAVLAALAVMSIPRVDHIEAVPVAAMEKYPALQDAYDELCYQHRYLTVATEESIQIITVKNIWGSWERYILPCFGVQTQTVPENGNVDFHSTMHVLSPWEEENVFTRMMLLSMDINISMDLGEYALASKLVEVIPGGSRHIDGTDYIEDHDCDKSPSLALFYSVGTSARAELLEGPQEIQAVFQWVYTLKINGVRIGFGEFSINQAFTVNA